MRNIIVREYLESLNETNELDYIFPLLLESMGFRIVSTPRNSRGQSQYGKDVIAIGKDCNGVKSRFYFELKGNAAKDINDRTFSEKDGFRDSIIAAKDTAYNDSSIPGFDSLPLRIVFVHNGLSLRFITFHDNRPCANGKEEGHVQEIQAPVIS